MCSVKYRYVLYDPCILTAGCWEHKFTALYICLCVWERAHAHCGGPEQHASVQKKLLPHVMSACSHRLFNDTKDHSLSHLNFIEVKNSIYSHINIRHIVEYPICPYGFKYLVFPFLRSFSICTTFFCNLQIFPEVDLIKHIFFICVCTNSVKNKIFKWIFFFTVFFLQGE